MHQNHFIVFVLHLHYSSLGLFVYFHLCTFLFFILGFFLQQQLFHSRQILTLNFLNLHLTYFVISKKALHSGNEDPELGKEI